MIDDRPLSADRVPTLTEVVELDLPAHPAGGAGAGGPVLAEDDGDTPVAPDEAPAVAAPDELGGEGASDEAPAAGAPGPAAAAEVEPELAPAAAVVEAEVAPEPEPAPVAAPAPAVDPPGADALPAAAVPLPALDVDAVVGQVLAELTPRIDMLLESRLREALAPALARAADGLIRDTRANLAVAVRDLVQEAVDRALQRRAEL